MLDLIQLRSFVLVCSEGSFTAAAERLGLSQPAVSQQVRLLEKAVRARLVERVGRKARPTPAGEELLKHAHILEAQVSTALEAVARHGENALGRVRIGTGASASIYVLPKALKALRDRWPQLELVVSVGSNERICHALAENRLDAALLSLPVSGRMFDVTRVFDEELVLIAPPTLELPPKLTQHAMLALPVIIPEKGGMSRQIVDHWLSIAGVSLKPVMELGSIEAIKELVWAGLGCAIVPAMAVSGVQRQYEFVVRSLQPPLMRSIGLVLRRDKPLSKGLRETVKELVALNR